MLARVCFQQPGALQAVRDVYLRQENSWRPSADKTAITNDVVQLEEIGDIISNTNLTAQVYFSAFSQTYQVGYSSSESVTVAFDGSTVTGSTLTALTSSTIAAASIATIATAAETALQKIGSLLQRLDVKETNINSAITNIQASMSRIMDADIAKEQVTVTKLNILQQMGVAQLSQANSAPQQYLQLFR